MSMELWEYQQEEAMAAYHEELYENELKERAVEEFTEERLKSFYVENPYILKKPTEFLNESKLIASYSSTASLLLSCSAIEVLIKLGILKPIIYGFVHNEVAAELIADSAIRQTGLDRFRELLAKLLMDVASIDIVQFRRVDASKTLWSERADVQKIRNNIAHKTEKCTAEDADLSITIAEAFLSQLIPQILISMNLELNPQGEIVEKE